MTTYGGPFCSDRECSCITSGWVDRRGKVCFGFEYSTGHYRVNYDNDQISPLSDWSVVQSDVCWLKAGVLKVSQPSGTFCVVT